MGVVTNLTHTGDNEKQNPSSSLAPLAPLAPLARGDGVLQKIERPGFCPSCYEGRRTREQIEANDMKAAYDYLAAAKAEGYSQADALIVAFSHNTGGRCPHRLPII